MDETCLGHRLTDDERRRFEDDGFLVVPGVLAPDRVAVLAAAAERLDAEWRPVRKVKPHEPLNLLDAIGKDDAFLDLLDLPQTFMKVVDILGWHIQLYHSHLIVTPPLPEGHVAGNPRLGWHQDSGRLNLELEGEPRSRVSLKVGFFFTSTLDADLGNFHVVPGSHRMNRLDLPEDPERDHPRATAVRVDAGDAVFFDRRLWHAAGRNRSAVTRKVLFLGYSYRWLRPRDDMTVAHYLPRADPIRRQLLGESPNGGFGYTSPAAVDVPLKTWLVERLGADGVVP
ncbi:MAG: phytanoyl-CoA dioxygenase family protein [Pseudomonadales bacterium]|nr:phytanoyl-CoA dioxygenase family protein [Pseudomonadales bacterium]